MPGHGDHWGTVCEAEEYLRERFSRDLEESALVCRAPCIDARHGTDRTEQVECLRWGGDYLAHQILVVSDSAEGGHYLFSAYPVALAGIAHRVRIVKAESWQHGIEGWIHATATGEGIPLSFFDSMFFMGSDALRPGAEADYLLAGLAYWLRPIRMRKFEISEGPLWAMERQRRLREGEPAEQAGRPADIHMTGAAVFLPCEGEQCDEARFQGVIEAVEAFEHDGQAIYRMEIVVVRPGDEEFRLPVFASERVLDGYVPRLGEDVEGLMWLQGRRVGAEGAGSPTDGVGAIVVD